MNLNCYFGAAIWLLVYGIFFIIGCNTVACRRTILNSPLFIQLQSNLDRKATLLAAAKVVFKVRWSKIPRGRGRDSGTPVYKIRKTEWAALKVVFISKWSPNQGGL